MTASVSRNLSFDPNELREKYREERNKRIRADGNDQYIEVTGDFSHYVDDPYVEPGFERDALETQVEVLIIGGGFGGMLAAARLRDTGINDLLIVEKGGGFGGTWYWNRYPGASCDIESLIYFPLLEETGFVPKQRYTNATETLEYCQVIAEQYKLHDIALMQTQILSTDWSEGEGLWVARTNRGDLIKATFVVHSNGPLNRPKLPGIPGIDTYTGHTFHTSRWDYNYTGGGPVGSLNKLADKRVAVIGTGATAVQCVPHLAAGAKALYVFQRTPSSIDVRNNTDVDAEWVKSQSPGWHHKRRTNFESLLAGVPVKEDLVRDGWTEVFRDIFGELRQHRPSGWRLLLWSLGWAFSSVRKERGFKQYLIDKAIVEMGLQEKMEIADFAKMEKIRARADALVDNSETAESLKPYYRQFCKRPCFHDEYLQAFNNPHVTLVDTDGQGVEAFTEKGVVANGKEYEVDCIVFATGFEVGTDYCRRAGYSITGVDGLSISEKWAEGMATFHGLHTRGFPNAFFFGPQQSAFTATYTFALDENAMQTAYILGELKKRGANRVDASEKAESAWINTIKRVARQNEEFQKSCTPGYYNNEGHVNFESQNTFYGGGPIEFFKLMAKWREAGDLRGLEIN